jgi:glutathione S-transferase
MSDYVDVETARRAKGMRLAVTQGVPGPWGESAKGILHVKRIPYLKVAQEAAGENAALKAWTGHSNAPVAVYDDEPPRAGWAEILVLAERVAPTPRLIPDSARERALMFGYAHELCGELGLGWNRRLMGLDRMLPRDGDPLRGDGPIETLGRRYGYTRANARAASERVAKTLAELSRRLREQRAAGSRFLVGDALSALDIYWAAFAALIEPLPDDVCPMPDYLRAFYTLDDASARSALDPELLAHRDFVYRSYLELPLRL